MELNDDDDEIRLPDDTLKILQSFLLEKAQREHDELEQIQQKAGKEATFEEDWQLSQFWYNQSTKDTLGRVVEKLKSTHCGEQFRIALLSCPSLYATIKSIHEDVNIFEYDKRFAAYGDDFVYYDFNEVDDENAATYLKTFAESFDLIIADPPFLSEECMTKMSQIIKRLQKPEGGKVIFCTGEVVHEWLIKCLPTLTKCKFQPEHERNLGNEFVSFANFNLDELV